MPSKISYDLKDNKSSFSLFDKIGEEKGVSKSFLPKVNNSRSKNKFFRPFSPGKKTGLESMLIKDFRTSISNRARSTGPGCSISTERANNNTFRTQIGNDLEFNQSFSTVPDNRRAQIKEVLNIKKRLASRQVLCPVRILESGLVLSEVDPIPVHKLPKGGELLIHVAKPKNKKTLKKKRKKGKKN